jgi:hypothetical protein
MAIEQSEIGRYIGIGRAAKSLQEAKSEGKPTAFLSHSHLDADLASGVQGYLQAHGWERRLAWLAALVQGEMASSLCLVGVRQDGAFVTCGSCGVPMARARRAARAPALRCGWRVGRPNANGGLSAQVLDEGRR